MISFDLCCTADHVFEVWFRSGADFDDQRARGLLLCPVCADTNIRKAVMAPNVGLKGNQKAQLPAVRSETAAPPAMMTNTTPPAADAPTDGAPAATPQMPALSPQAMAMLAAVARAQAEALPQSQWVGRRFAEEARARHAAEGDAPQGPIHGQATPDEAERLLDDGIAVMPLLVPVVPPELQN